MGETNPINTFLEGYWNPNIKQIEKFAKSIDPNDYEDLISDTLVSIIEELNKRPSVLAILEKEGIKPIQIRMMYVHRNLEGRLLTATVVNIESVKGARLEGDTMNRVLRCDGFSNQPNNSPQYPNTILFMDPELLEIESSETGPGKEPTLFKKDRDYVLSSIDPCLGRSDYFFYDYGRDIAKALSKYDRGRKLYVSPQQISEAVNFVIQNFTNNQLSDLLQLINYLKTDSTRFVFARRVLNHRTCQEDYLNLTDILIKYSSLDIKRYVEEISTGKLS